MNEAYPCVLNNAVVYGDHFYPTAYWFAFAPFIAKRISPPLGYFPATEGCGTVDQVGV